MTLRKNQYKIFCLETDSLYVTQAGLELTEIEICLSLPPEYLDERCVPSLLT